MNSETSAAYAVYDLTTRFSIQPGDMRFCPICKKMLVVKDIPKSRAISADLSYDAPMSKHYFTRLYRCSVCNWWAIREAWENYLERGYDYLIVSNNETPENKIEQFSPWSQALENKHIYNDSMSLPDNLGKFFVDRADKNTAKFVPGDKVRLVADSAVYQPTLYFIVTQGSLGTVVSFTEYSAALEPLKKRLESEGNFDHELIRFKFWEVDFDLRKGFYYAVQIDRLEPSSAKQPGDALCSESEIYLVEAIHLRKIG